MGLRELIESMLTPPLSYKSKLKCYCMVSIIQTELDAFSMQVKCKFCGTLEGRDIILFYFTCTRVEEMVM